MRGPHSRVEPTALAAVAVGGVIGSLGRYAVGHLLPHAVGEFPWATLLVNVSGAFGMGLLVAFLVDRRHKIAHGLNESGRVPRALELKDTVWDLGDWFIRRFNPDRP